MTQHNCRQRRETGCSPKRKNRWSISTCKGLNLAVMKYRFWSLMLSSIGKGVRKRDYKLISSLEENWSYLLHYNYTHPLAELSYFLSIPGSNVTRAQNFGGTLHIMAIHWKHPWSFFKEGADKPRYGQQSHSYCGPQWIPVVNSPGLERGPAPWSFLPHISYVLGNWNIAGRGFPPYLVSSLLHTCLPGSGLPSFTACWAVLPFYHTWSGSMFFQAALLGAWGHLSVSWGIEGVKSGIAGMLTNNKLTLIQHHV